MKSEWMTFLLLLVAVQVCSCTEERAPEQPPAGGGTATGGGTVSGGSGGDGARQGLCDDPGDGILLGRPPSPDCEGRMCGEYCDPCSQGAQGGEGGSAGASSCSSKGVYRCNYSLQCDRIVEAP